MVSRHADRSSAASGQSVRSALRPFPKGHPPFEVFVLPDVPFFDESVVEESLDEAPDFVSFSVVLPAAFSVPGSLRSLVLPDSVESASASFVVSVLVLSSVVWVAVVLISAVVSAAESAFGAEAKADTANTAVIIRTARHAIILFFIILLLSSQTRSMTGILIIKGQNKMYSNINIRSVFSFWSTCIFRVIKENLFRFV